MKRILFMTQGRAEPGSGAGERSISIHRALARLGEVHVLVVLSPGTSHEARAGEASVELLAPGKRATRWHHRKSTYLFRDYRPNRRVAEAVAAMHATTRFDAFVGQYQLPVLGACHRWGPSFIDFADLPTDFSRPKVPLMRTLQRAALNHSIKPLRGVFVTKRADASKIVHPRVEVLPCISTQPDAIVEVPVESAAPRLLFVGGLTWRPNREGVMRFVQNVLPRITEKVPGARLRLVGVEGERAAGYPAVDVAGFVPDIGAEYRNAPVCVCPIWGGSGSIVKLAEAAGFGRAIVATPYAARGFEGVLEPGRDMLVADSDADFADRCVELLCDERLRARLAANAKAAARRGLSQNAVDEVVERTVGAALHQDDGRRSPGERPSDPSPTTADALRAKARREMLT